MFPWSIHEGFEHIARYLSNPSTINELCRIGILGSDESDDRKVCLVLEALPSCFDVGKSLTEAQLSLRHFQLDVRHAPLIVEEYGRQGFEDQVVHNCSGLTASHVFEDEQDLGRSVLVIQEGNSVQILKSKGCNTFASILHEMKLSKSWTSYRLFLAETAKHACLRYSCEFYTMNLSEFYFSSLLKRCRKTLTGWATMS